MNPDLVSHLESGAPAYVVTACGDMSPVVMYAGAPSLADALYELETRHPGASAEVDRALESGALSGTVGGTRWFVEFRNA